MSMKTRFLPLALALIPVVYILTMPLQYVIGDPWDELQLALSSETVFRPHHLLTTVLYRVVLFLLSWLPGTSVLHLELFMIVTAVLAAYGLYRIVGPGLAAAGAALVFAFSHAVMLHGSTIETGMPALAALMWSVYAAQRSHRVADESAGWRDNDGPERWRLLSAGLFSLSVLLHIQTIVLFPALLVLLLPPLHDREFWKVLATTCLSAGLILASIYLAAAVGVMGMRDPALLWTWLTTHHSQQSLTHLGAGPIAVARSASGVLRLFVDIGDSGTAVRGLLTGQHLAAAGLRQLLQLAAAGFVLLTLVWWSWRGRTSSPRVTAAAVIAAVCLLAFNSFWLGSDPQFWLDLLPFFLPLAAAGLQRGQDSILHRGWLLAVLLVLIAANVTAREPSLLYPNGDDAHAKAELFSLQHRGEIILTPGSRWTSALVSMQAPVEVWQMFRFEDIHDLRAHLDALLDDAQARGKIVCVEGLDPAEGEMVGIWESVSSQFGITREAWRAQLAERYNFVPVSLGGAAPDAVLYRLAARN
jgi:hypothetical protein